MKPFFDTRTKRRATFVVLLVWLFALASGVANACLPQARTSQGLTAAHSLAPGDAHEGFGGQARAAAHDHADMAAAKASCVKACDDGSRSLLKQPGGVAFTDPGLAPFVALAWSAAAPVVVVLDRAGDLRPLSSGPPVRALYSRLAL